LPESILRLSGYCEPQREAPILNHSKVEQVVFEGAKPMRAA